MTYYILRSGSPTAITGINPLALVVTCVAGGGRFRIQEVHPQVNELVYITRPHLAAIQVLQYRE